MTTSHSFTVLVFSVLLVLIGACATYTQSDASVCPLVVQYTLDEQRQLAKEIEGLPEEAMVVRALKDYGVLRKQLKAIQ